MKKWSLFLLVGLLVGLSLQAAPAVKRRGKYLRTEERKVETRKTYTVSLAQTKSSFPILFFQGQSILVHHEVRIHEVLMEITHENNGEGITQRGSVEYTLVPGETMPGEEIHREEIRQDGPLANMEFQVNGMVVRTDSQGHWIDTAQTLVAPFDDLRARALPLTIKHPELGEQTLTVTRNLIRRESTAKDGSSDLLENFSLDFTQLRRTDVTGLTTKLIMAASATAGSTIPATIEVANTGSLPISNLVARSFSSDPLLNGRWFYFGNLPPGEKHAFSRLFQVKDGTNVRFVRFAFWSILGPIPAKNCDATLQVLPATP